MGRFLRGVDVVNDWAGKASSYFIVVMLGLLLLEIIVRYFLNVSLAWTHEISVFLFISYVFMAGGYNLLHKRHITMDLIYQRFPAKVRFAVEVAVFLCILVFCGLLLWMSIDHWWGSVQVRQTTISNWGPPVYPVKTMMPLGFLLFLLQGLANFIRTVAVFLGKAELLPVEEKEAQTLG